MIESPSHEQPITETQQPSHHASTGSWVTKLALLEEARHIRVRECYSFYTFRVHCDYPTIFIIWGKHMSSEPVRYTVLGVLLTLLL